MLTQELAVEIQVLNKQGRSIRQIARETGLSRNTVRRYLREGRPIRYGPREPRACKLDAYKGFLQERMAQARPDWIPATVLLREIRAAGYPLLAYTVNHAGRAQELIYRPTRH